VGCLNTGRHLCVNRANDGAYLSGCDSNQAIWRACEAKEGRSTGTESTGRDPGSARRAAFLLTLTLNNPTSAGALRYRHKASQLDVRARASSLPSTPPTPPTNTDPIIKFNDRKIPGYACVSRRYKNRHRSSIRANRDGEGTRRDSPARENCVSALSTFRDSKLQLRSCGRSLSGLASTFVGLSKRSNPYAYAGENEK